MSGRTLNSVYIAGRNVISEALKSGREFKRIYLEKTIENSVKSSQNAKIQNILDLAKTQNIEIIYISKEEIRDLEEKAGIKSEGIIAQVEEMEDQTIEDVLALCKRKNKEPFILILNNVLYEENLGAVLRTAAAGGADALIIPKRDKRELTATVRRISMGGSEYVPLIKENLFEVLDTLKDEGIRIVGIEMSGESYYFEKDLTGPIAFVIGGESAGVSTPLLKRCDEIVKIPMLRSIDSLNLSVSAGIVIYEKIRQECQK